MIARNFSSVARKSSTGNIGHQSVNPRTHVRLARVHLANHEQLHHSSIKGLRRTTCLILSTNLPGQTFPGPIEERLPAGQPVGRRHRITIGLLDGNVGGGHKGRTSQQQARLMAAATASQGAGEPPPGASVRPAAHAAVRRRRAAIAAVEDERRVVGHIARDERSTRAAAATGSASGQPGP